MKIQGLSILLLLLMTYVKSNKMYYNEYYLITRNNFLRALLTSKEYKKTKMLINKTSYICDNIYNKILSGYYDLNGKYHSLSEDDKTIIETIISLCY
jgi:hypothetical protein